MSDYTSNYSNYSPQSPYPDISQSQSKENAVSPSEHEGIDKTAHDTAIAALPQMATTSDADLNGVKATSMEVEIDDVDDDDEDDMQMQEIQKRLMELKKQKEALSSSCAEDKRAISQDTNVMIKEESLEQKDLSAQDDELSVQEDELSVQQQALGQADVVNEAEDIVDVKLEHLSKEDALADTFSLSQLKNIAHIFKTEGKDAAKNIDDIVHFKASKTDKSKVTAYVPEHLLDKLNELKAKGSLMLPDHNGVVREVTIANVVTLSKEEYASFKEKFHTHLDNYIESQKQPPGPKEQPEVKKHKDVKQGTATTQSTIERRKADKDEKKATDRMGLGDTTVTGTSSAQVQREIDALERKKDEIEDAKRRQFNEKFELKRDILKQEINKGLILTGDETKIEQHLKSANDTFLGALRDKALSLPKENKTTVIKERFREMKVQSQEIFIKIGNATGPEKQRLVKEYFEKINTFVVELNGIGSTSTQTPQAGRV